VFVHLCRALTDHTVAQTKERTFIIRNRRPYICESAASIH